MKKTLISFLSIVSLVSLLGCSNKEKIKIAFISDYRDVVEPSFVKDSYDACLEWANENKTELYFRKPNGNTIDNRNISLRLVSESGYDNIVCSGASFISSFKTILTGFPMHRYIVVGASKDDVKDVMGEEMPSNLYCIDFKNEIVGYALGYSVVKEGYQDVGFVGSYNTNEVNRYGYGFIQGINDASIELNKEVTLRYGYANTFSVDGNVESRIDTWFGQGMKVCFACGDEIYKGIYESAIKKGVNGKVISCDRNLYDTLEDKYKNSYFMSTSVNYKAAIKKVLNEVVNKDVKGKVYSFGLDSDTRYVDLQTSEWRYKNFSKDDYNNLINKISLSQINIRDNVSEMPSVNELVNLQNNGNIKG